MKQKLIIGMVVLFAMIAGVFWIASSSASYFMDSRAVVTAEGQDAELSGWEEERLAPQECIGKDVYAYLRSELRLPGISNVIAGIKENVRRRSSQLLLFAVLFCTAFKHVVGGISAILFICMIFISYFHIRIKVLHQGDGKKWSLSFLLV